ncbi:low-temperature-induced 65 kDa protein-like [Durio zibethinus]|uniref:Low-temperature-induced 65 kDa protein-like n=1 Tax=Durio zibethinus TaxID=66656 RepID=A0A6P5YAJ4_DURZI|nr:low-temperature-induced 65 kDa protein-like [Durio zibethinus]
MDTQSAYPRGYSQEHDPNIVGHQHGDGEDEHHHEKKSVLKKVKAKAKKIKDTIKKHGHGYNQDHDYGHNHDHDYDHEYHDGHVPEHHDLDDEDEDEQEIVEDPEVHGAPIYESAAVKSVVSGQSEELSRPGITYERLMAMDPDPLPPSESAETFYSGNYKTEDSDPTNRSVPGLKVQVTEQPRVNFEKTTAIVVEPIAPPNTPVSSSHRSKDANPTKTFVHGQEENARQPKVNLQRPKGLEEDPAAPKDTPNAYTTTNYQTKITDPSGKGGEATGITPILHSLDKMNIHNKQDTEREENFPPGTHHRASHLSFPTGSHDQFSPEPTTPLPIETSENPTLLSETMDTSKPQEHSRNVTSDKPSNQSSYTEKISSATSAVTDKAVSAKNIIASKLGYGEKDQTTINESHEGQDATKQASAIDYGKKMAAIVTEKLTPVCEKVTEAGGNVKSKLHGPGTGTASEVGTEALERDKGVSMKGYIAEKLRPSEGDRALSEVILDALHKRNENPEKETMARGKVTESEEVARRLGIRDERDERPGSSAVNSPNKGVVDKLKGAVGSWFGKREESQEIQQAYDSSYGNAGFSCSAVERRLEEESGS